MTTPSGADTAGARNRAAVETLTEQAGTPIGAAIGEMLAAVLADLGTGSAAPVADVLASRARSSWAASVGRILAWVRDTFTRLVSRAVDNLPDDIAEDLAPELTPAALNEQVGRIVADLADALNSVPDVLASRTATALGEGYERGESPAELRDRVAEVLDRDAWDPEVERIARTTTTSVYGAAHTAVANDLERQLGEPLRRMWIATQDTRTRETHRRAHAQVIPSGERFRVGNALLRFPGDPLGPPEEVINCRCLAVAVLDDMVIDLAHRVAGREANALTNDEPLAAASTAGGIGWAAATWQAWRLLAARAVVALTRIPPALRTYWTRGEGAAKIRWGSPGDFNRCRRALRKYVSPAQLSGLCANLHHAALGVWPGQEGASAVVSEETEMPCPCEGMTDEEIRAAVGELTAATAAATPAAPPRRRSRATDRRDEQTTEVDEGDEQVEDESDVPDGVEPEHPARKIVRDAEEDDVSDCDSENGEDCPPSTDSTDDAAENAAENAEDEVVATVTGDPDLPFVDRDVAWDGSAAEQAVAAWAATEDGVDPERYGRAFFYRDPDANPRTQAAYKLGFATVVDGELRAVPKGIFAVAAVLQGGRGGADIPQDEQDRIKSRVAGYYRRMADQFDDDSITVPWGGTASAAADAVTAAPENPTAPGAEPGAEPLPQEDEAGDDALDDARTGGMVALLPAEADAARLAVDGEGAIPADELHVTLLFLGDGTDWLNPDQPDQPNERGQALLDLAQRVAADVGPYTGTVWQIGATGNDTPTGGTAMYLVGDDTGRLAELHGGLMMAAGDLVPEQHSPWVAHISTRYGNASTDGMDAMGSDITFDRIRVVFAGQAQDFPLTGDDSLDLDEADEEDDMEAATASASTNSWIGRGKIEYPELPELRASLAAAQAVNTIVAQAAENAPEHPPAEWFRPIRVDGPTPPTVTADGRVWGHIGQAGVCHVGIRDECVTIPPTRTGYGAFHREEIQTAEGDMVSVGYLYTGCDHSSTEPGMGIDEARDYLDAACVRTAAGRVYDTEFGPMFVGTVMPGVTAADVAKLHKLSGEWFTAPLELHAAVGVEDAGFPVDGTEDTLRTAAAAPPLAASAHIQQIEDYRRQRAGNAVIAAARTRATRELAAYTKRG